MSSEESYKSACCSTRKQLIEAGLEELVEYGYMNFSTRRVAKRCGVSCAAPYKHFTDTEQFVCEIVQYIDDLYACDVNELLEAHSDASIQTKIVLLAMAYINFAVTHPDYHFLATHIPYDHPASKYQLAYNLQSLTQYFKESYITETGIPPEEQKQKIFLLRSVIYGATHQFTTGKLEYTEENRKMIYDYLLQFSSPANHALSDI